MAKAVCAGMSKEMLIRASPFDFRYEFACDDPGCRGHKLLCTDWETAESYHDWRKEHQDGWEAKFRERYEHDMTQRFDTHSYVGTLHGHPDTWIIVGLFYAPLAGAFFCGGRRHEDRDGGD